MLRRVRGYESLVIDVQINNENRRAIMTLRQPPTFLKHYLTDYSW